MSRFQVATSVRRLGAPLFTWRRGISCIFILLEIKLISLWKILRQDSFRKRGKQFGNCLLTSWGIKEHGHKQNFLFCASGQKISSSLPQPPSASVVNIICHSQVAEKALFRLRQLQGDITEIQSQLGGTDLGVSWSWKMEEAKLRWARSEQDTAMYLLKSLTRNLEQVTFTTIPW